MGKSPVVPAPDLRTTTGRRPGVRGWPPDASATVLWALRLAWLAAPLLVGPALGHALDERSSGVQAVASGLAWGGWVAVLVATLVPRASSLTAIRLGVPGALAVAAWSAGLAGADEAGGRGVVAVAAGAATLAVSLAPGVGDAFVNGSSYGSERRFALRCPPLLALLAVGAWSLAAAGATAGPLLLAAERWVAGAVALVVGLPVAAVGARAVHGLSRRWLVLVPSGLVVHDPLARPDSVMAPRPLITHLGPAPEGTEALDLTLGAPGLALELVTSEPLPVTVRRGRSLETREATRVLVTPVRPAAVMAEAASRSIPT